MSNELSDAAASLIAETARRPPSIQGALSYNASVLWVTVKTGLSQVFRSAFPFHRILREINPALWAERIQKVMQYAREQMIGDAQQFFAKFAKEGGWKDISTYHRMLYLAVIWTVRVVRRILSTLNFLLVPARLTHVYLRHTFALVVLWLTWKLWRLAMSVWDLTIREQLDKLVHSPEFLERKRQLTEAMENATTYEDWQKAAEAMDELEGLMPWKENASSPFYDHHRIKSDLVILRELVDKTLDDGNQLPSLMHYLRARLMRNLGNSADKRLYKVLRSGTKYLIEEYHAEVIRALQLVCVVQCDRVPASQRLSFFNETRHSFGRSALMFSGGATMGMYHAGVVKALHENRLLPRVVSGASVGSIIAAIMGTRTDDQLYDAFCGRKIVLNFFPSNKGSIRRKIQRLFREGVLMDINILTAAVRQNVPDLTFQEAYDLTGRITNIAISPSSGKQEAHRLLNYLTAPHVLIWSAAVASCAIPGVYNSVELMCKDEHGQIVPYYQQGVKWSDGSVHSDLPMVRLSELFNVNHFIVSQTNPHVVPFLVQEQRGQAAANLLSRGLFFILQELKDLALNLVTLGFTPQWLEQLTLLLDQKYVGDITIVPKVKLSDYRGLLTNPTYESLESACRTNELETWKQLHTIRAHCEIEFTLDECVKRMRGSILFDAVHQSATDAIKQEKFMQRIRSWTADQFADAHLSSKIRAGDLSPITGEAEDSKTLNTTWRQRLAKRRSEGKKAEDDTEQQAEELRMWLDKEEEREDGQAIIQRDGSDDELLVNGHAIPEDLANELAQEHIRRVLSMPTIAGLQARHSIPPAASTMSPVISPSPSPPRNNASSPSGSKPTHPPVRPLPMPLTATVSPAGAVPVSPSAHLAMAALQLPAFRTPAPRMLSDMDLLFDNNAAHATHPRHGPATVSTHERHLAMPHLTRSVSDAGGVRRLSSPASLTGMTGPQIASLREGVLAELSAQANESLDEKTKPSDAAASGGLSPSAAKSRGADVDLAAINSRRGAKTLSPYASHTQTPAVPGSGGFRSDARADEIVQSRLQRVMSFADVTAQRADQLFASANMANPATTAAAVAGFGSLAGHAAHIENPSGNPSHVYTFGAGQSDAHAKEEARGHGNPLVSESGLVDDTDTQ